uniref:Putative secreted protein n=1 Tax=Ixodes ricinus TaxID=34613 RepID=A0A6B0UHM4_IXORI
MMKNGRRIADMLLFPLTTAEEGISLLVGSDHLWRVNGDQVLHCKENQKQVKHPFWLDLSRPSVKPQLSQRQRQQHGMRAKNGMFHEGGGRRYPAAFLGAGEHRHF